MDETGRESESSTLPIESSSGWTVNWTGAFLLLLIATIVLIGWRRVDNGPVGSQDADAQAVSTTSEPSGAGERSSTTTRRTTTTTRAPRTTTATSTTVTPERRVLISGEMKPCRFGSNCLVASFTIEGFDAHPGEFDCVYPNSRTTLGFNDDDVDDACLSGDEGDTIAIEVDGVVSATVSERNLDGTDAGD